MITNNYYDILGVDQNADQETIKKVYRQKAKEFHPDKGGDETMFKKISEAYEVLVDEGKRNEYDNRNNNPFGGFNPFGNFFGGFNSYSLTQHKTLTKISNPNFIFVLLTLTPSNISPNPSSSIISFAVSPAIFKAPL